MATRNRALSLVTAAILLLPICHTVHILETCGFDSIYQLGDSVSDTGNLIRENPSSVYAKLPYGETYFNNATGRCSNGLIMIDYFARSAGLPFLDAYLNENASHGSGVDFAVAGATALSVEILSERESLVTVPDDWSYQETSRQDLNNLSIYHNTHLKKALETLRKEHPNVIIVYGDIYEAYNWILSDAKILGFDAESIQRACCGIGGDYNFNITKMCGVSGVPVCSNPDKSLSWDGAHLTQQAYKFMARWLIYDIYPKLQCQ
ncbi:Lipase, GDSL [Corchorus olitorius]|uniref:Lipase, GDSL n=1 Tax=Corchorus olitorius TaxID=93759 RepID=A0A1R3JCI0_9ROSI|nr:Lipase, GDSL [Corchorus olitorius]